MELSKHCSFEDKLAVDPWRALVHEIGEYLDEEQFQTLLLFSKKELDEDTYNNFLRSGVSEFPKFVLHLERTQTKNEVLEYLHKRIERLKLHGQHGSVSYAEELKKIQDALKMAETLAQMPHFVGREHVITSILSDLETFKGVVICGTNGIGKTSLANRVCCLLQTTRKKYDIYVVDQRDKVDLQELLCDLVYKLPVPAGVNLSHFNPNKMDIIDLKMLCLDMIKELNKRCHASSSHHRALLYLDDVDSHCDTKEKRDAFLHFLRELLSEIDCADSNVKLLVTVDTQLSKFDKIPEEKIMLLENQLVEVELEPLSEVESVQLLRSVSQKKEETDHLDDEFRELSLHCEGIPMTLVLVACLLKNGFTAQAILTEYQSAKTDTMFKFCLKKLVYMIEKRDAELLVRLTVFQLASFNVDMVIKSCACDTHTKRHMSISEREAWLKNDLSVLKSCCLIEEDRLAVIDQINIIHEQKSEWHCYSLHPLVFKNIRTGCGHDFMNKLEASNDQFLKYLCRQIEEYGKSFEGMQVYARNKFFNENLMLYKLCFRTIMYDQKPLKHFISGQDRTTKLQKKVLVLISCIWNVADLILNHSERTLFAKIQARMESKQRNLFEYIYWVACKADNLIMEGEVREAGQVISDVMLDFGITVNEHVVFTDSSVSGWYQNEDEKIPALAMFCLAKGRVTWKSNQNTELVKNDLSSALMYLNFAEKTLAGELKTKPIEKTYKAFCNRTLADIINLKGSIYFLLQDYKSATDNHKMALRKAKRMEYQANLAACLHQQAIRMGDSEKRIALLDKALDSYNECCPSSDTYLISSQITILRNRAEVYNLRDKGEEALEDGKRVHEFFIKKYPKPHIETMHAAERLAHYHLKLGLKLKTQINDEYKIHVGQSARLYEELLACMKARKLSVRYNNGRFFSMIRRNHINLIKHFEPERQSYLEMEYQAIEGFSESDLGNGLQEQKVPMVKAPTNVDVANSEEHLIDVESGTMSNRRDSGYADIDASETDLEPHLIDIQTKETGFQSNVQDGQNLPTETNNYTNTSTDIITDSFVKPRPVITRQKEIDLSSIDDLVSVVNKSRIKLQEDSDRTQNSKNDAEFIKSADESKRELYSTRSNRTDSGRESWSSSSMSTSDSILPLANSSKTLWSVRSESNSSQVFSSMESEDGVFYGSEIGTIKLPRLESQQSLTSGMGAFNLGVSEDRSEVESNSDTQSNETIVNCNRRRSMSSSETPPKMGYGVSKALYEGDEQTGDASASKIMKIE